MAKKKEKIVESAGNVDWEKLESMPQNREKNLEELVDKEGIEAEKKKLTDKEKALPYPEDFLADINLLRKNIDSQTRNLNLLEEEDDDQEDDDQDDDDYEEDDILYEPSPKKSSKKHKPKALDKKNNPKKTSKKK
ncbi:MAG: hypothetical protein OHK0038_02790 [Flammeovirgaceae bacterium]